MSNPSFQERLEQLNHLDQFNQWCQDLDFDQWGSTRLAHPVSLTFYETWLAKHYHGQMKYLAAHLPKKKNPQLIHPRLQSALVFTHSYVPHPAPSNEKSSLRIALYAQGQDYHYWLKAKLESIQQKLEALFPNEVFICATDSAPVLERDLAYRSRLGWIGKNTCLIHPKKGSLFLVGEILTSLSIAPTPETMHDFCGTCTRCIDICPTSALEEPRLLNANKCISYLTIESRELPPEAIRPQIKDWFFGCDLCQTVCPWNQKLFGQNLDTRPQRTVDTDSRQELIIELREILTLSGKKLEKKYAHSPLQRAGPFGLRRNAIVVAANQNLVELIPEIREQSRHDKLQDLVDWALSQLKNHRV